MRIPFKEALSLKKDAKLILITTLAFGLVLSWHGWGVERFELSKGLANFFLAVIAGLVTSVAYIAAQKAVGAWKGLIVKHALWWYGLVFCLGIVFLTNGGFKIGFVPITLYSLTKFELDFKRSARLGKKFIHPTLKEHAAVALSGPLAVFLLGGFLKTLELIGLVGGWANLYFIFTLLVTATNLLPIPPIDGAKLFYSSAIGYAFVSGAFVGYLILAAFGVFSYIWALIIGFATGAFFYFAVEKKWA